MSEPAPPHVVVLGGGSAGWITASLLHRRWGERGGRVTVVEDPATGIIGVGEGSTPQLKALFDYLGIAERDWMARCDATYKLGIRFTGWSERPGFESYFHPFPGPVDLHSEPAFLRNCALARRAFDVACLPDRFFLSARLAELGRSPHPSENFPFAPSYGYHFDAYKLGAFLKEWGAARGIKHVAAKVTGVPLDEDGNVTALLCDDGRRLDGDIFVDCSGFRAIIAEGALGARYRSFDDNLFNDRAVVLPGPRPQDFRPQTESVAMSAGWRWSIPLTGRTGNGYVYSSRHISDEDAERELREATGLRDPAAEARFLKMRVGRLETSWTANCLAAGLSQGFIEPLEATALHIVIATATEFADAYEEGGFSAVYRDRFNDRIAERYDAIRDYIVAHYRLNQRSDGSYWQENAQNSDLSDRLKAMMTAWFTHKDIGAANAELYPVQAYSSASWHCLFAGYGSFPPQEKFVTCPPQAQPADMSRLDALMEACAINFPSAGNGGPAG